MQLCVAYLHPNPEHVKHLPHVKAQLHQFPGTYWEEGFNFHSLVSQPGKPLPSTLTNALEVC